MKVHENQIESIVLHVTESIEAQVIKITTIMQASTLMCFSFHCGFGSHPERAGGQVPPRHHNQGESRGPGPSSTTSQPGRESRGPGPSSTTSQPEGESRGPGLSSTTSQPGRESRGPGPSSRHHNQGEKAGGQVPPP